MRMYDLILKKKQGKELNTEEINWMIKEFTEGRIPDYQMSAMTMAICFQGMDKRETFDLTMAMRDSGDVLDLSRIDGIKVDKHSTGGVGDKVSLVLTPIVASLGVPVAKMSGRGLGHTGGTIDKLESFSGFSTEISEEKFIDSVNTIGIAIAGQTANLAPADKKLYALRDVTATVDQMSLIASSIMSKKLASGADAIVLDVKTGNGAFMQKEEDAIALAKAMVDIGNRAGKQTVAVITDMDEPLGNAVGNALEIKEVIDALHGDGPEDLMEVVYALGTQMLLLAKRAEDEEIARNLITESIQERKALKKFAEFIENQGGNREEILHPDMLPKARYVITVLAEEEGCIERILAQDIGIACMTLGGGRENKESTIDHGVGIVLTKKISNMVKKGETLALIHANSKEKAVLASGLVKNAYQIAKEPAKKAPMVKCIIRE